MELSLPQLKMRRRIWLKWLVLSVGTFVASAGFLFRQATAPLAEIPLTSFPPSTDESSGRVPVPQSSPAHPSSTPAPEPPSSVPLLTSIASFVTALVTLIGFIYTSLLTWRKERREAVLANLEVEKRRLDNEKLRRGLEQARSSGKPHLDL